MDGGADLEYKKRETEGGGTARTTRIVPWSQTAREGARAHRKKRGELEHTGIWHDAFLD
jgi:hypothetical protein